jgi:shikimate kinase
MNIYLIGYRCTGKTTVGKLLSQKLSWPMLDSDVELVKEQKRPIAEIVEKEGWPSFRSIEKEIIRKLSRLNHHVIATGGGAVLDPENVGIMRTTGKVIWLTALPETIARRMADDKSTGNNRPALTDRGIFDEIEETLNFRNPLYEGAMDFSIETDAMTIEEICELIQKRIKV